MVHTQRDSTGDSVRCGRHTFPSKYYKEKAKYQSHKARAKHMTRKAKHKCYVRFSFFCTIRSDWPGKRLWNDLFVCWLGLE